jgi:hypothetical protein
MYEDIRDQRAPDSTSTEGSTSSQDNTPKVHRAILDSMEEFCEKFLLRVQEGKANPQDLKTSLKHTFCRLIEIQRQCDVALFRKSINGFAAVDGNHYPWRKDDDARTLYQLGHQDLKSGLNIKLDRLEKLING